MFRNVISPIQAWLLSQGRCVGCGMPLAYGKIEKHKMSNEKITCKCKRIYLHDKKTGKYRRALIEEV